MSDNVASGCVHTSYLNPKQSRDTNIVGARGSTRM